MESYYKLNDYLETVKYYHLSNLILKTNTKYPYESVKLKHKD